MNPSIQNPHWYPVLAQGWTMSRAKAIFESFDSGVWGEDPYDDDSSTPVIRSNEIDEGGDWRVTAPALRLLSPSEKVKARLREGDLLIVKSSGSHAHIGKTAVVTKEIEQLGSCFSNFTGRIRILRHRANSKFLWYFLNNSPGRDQLFYYGTTTTGLINLSATSIGVGVLALPPLPEQERIAAYLDASCMAIDAAVAAKRHQIETLDAIHQSSLHRAFANESWPQERAKDLASKIGSGVTPEGGATGYLVEGIPLLRSQNIHFGGLRLDDVAFISEETHAEMSSSQLKPRDVLLNITGASIGRCTFVPENFGEGNVNQHVCIIRGNHRIDHRFLAAFLSSPMGQGQVLSAFTGASRQGLSHKELGLISIPLPSIGVQRDVVAVLERLKSQQKQLRDKIGLQIDALVAYRKSLIHECLTGQRRISKDDLSRVQPHG